MTDFLDELGRLLVSWKGEAAGESPHKEDTEAGTAVT